MGMGMGMGFAGAVAVEPMAFSSYQWGSNKFDAAPDHDEGSAGCGMGNPNGFCGQWSAPAASFSGAMASMCDFSMGMGGSYDQEQDDAYGDAQPAFVCDVVGPAPQQYQQQQQQQHTFFSPSAAFCAPRR